MHVRVIRRAVASAFLVAVLLSAPALTTPAYAAAEVHYVALGDSYSSGLGAGAYDISGCLRSGRGFPSLWAAAHRPTTFRSMACVGAETGDVRSGQLSALSARTTLVTITVGGNDAGFLDVIVTCLLGTDTGCASAVDAGKTFATDRLPARLDATYAAIRERAPNARLVVLGYPYLFENATSCGLINMNQYRRRIINQGVDVLAEVIAARARAAGAVWQDARDDFAGHGICATAPWIHGTAGLIEAYHPNAAGHRSGYLPAVAG